MISERHNFLFIHIPKTGGNSVQNILKNYSEDKIILNLSHQDGINRFGVKSDKFKIKKHSTYTEYQQQIPAETFSKLLKISTIRNPWDRCISYYFSPLMGNVKWSKEVFKQYVINSIKPNCHYLANYSNIDVLLKFENLATDFEKLLTELKLPLTPLPHNNKSESAHYSEYYDDELINFIGERFKEDIEFGNYRFNEQ